MEKEAKLRPTKQINKTRMIFFFSLKSLKWISALKMNAILQPMFSYKQSFTLLPILQCNLCLFMIIKGKWQVITKESFDSCRKIIMITDIIKNALMHSDIFIFLCIFNIALLL